MNEHEDPQTDYEKALDRLGLDCSRYACWKPIQVIVTYASGEKRGFCAKHAERGVSQQWLES
jgi:hypothetical protein